MFLFWDGSAAWKEHTGFSQSAPWGPWPNPDDFDLFQQHWSPYY
jgi:hypothetical protein